MRGRILLCLVLAVVPLTALALYLAVDNAAKKTRGPASRNRRSFALSERISIVSSS
jgi:hypothetical protein